MYQTPPVSHSAFEWGRASTAQVIQCYTIGGSVFLLCIVFRVCFACFECWFVVSFLRVFVMLCVIFCSKVSGRSFFSFHRPQDGGGESFLGLRRRFYSTGCPFFCTCFFFSWLEFCVEGIMF